MRSTYLNRIALILGSLAGLLGAAELPKYDYRLLATNKTSTMEKELNQAAAQGFAFSSVMGGVTAGGGSEVVVVMTRKPGAGMKQYRLLATSRTSTMQKELQQAADEGFDYLGQTVFSSMFGGREVSVILERDPAAPKRRSEFRLLATSRTSTMEKELNEAGQEGFEILNLSVGATALGGHEVVAILRRPVQPAEP